MEISEDRIEELKTSLLTALHDFHEREEGLCTTEIAYALIEILVSVDGSDEYLDFVEEVMNEVICNSELEVCH